MGEIGEWSRVQKEHRKRQKRASNAPRPSCRDWIFVHGSHHYAKNRNTFATYRRVDIIPTRLGNIVGVGSVLLTVRRNPVEKDTLGIRLLDVLHIPDAPCNAFSPFRKRSRLDVDIGEDFVKCYKEGQSFCYGKAFRGYKRLVLADNVYGGSSLDDARRTGKKLPLGIGLSEEVEKKLGLIQEEKQVEMPKESEIYDLQPPSEQPFLCPRLGIFGHVSPASAQTPSPPHPAPIRIGFGIGMRLASMQAEREREMPPCGCACDTCIRTSCDLEDCKQNILARR